MKKTTASFVLVFGLFIYGCPDGSTSRLDLGITFPDASARTETIAVEAMVIKPGPDATCSDLLSGVASPGADGYKVEDQLTITLPADQSDGSLKVKGSGERLFFARGLDGADEVFLKGCTRALARPSGVTEVSIALLRVGGPCTTDADCDDELYCTGDETCVDGLCQTTARECDDDDLCTDDSCDEDNDTCVNSAVTTAPGTEGPEGDVTCSDSIDNDCDGLTDIADPECAACTTDGDCDDSNECTTDTCETGGCLNEAVTDGTTCADNLFCNGDETCQSGVCEAGSRDCDDDDFCTDDSCDEDLDTCVNSPVAVPPGSEGPVGDPTCTDGLDNDCDGLTDDADTECLPCNNDNDCDDSNECTTDTCEASGCLNEDVTDGTGCDDGDPCTDTDQCNSGLCSGQPLDCSHLDGVCVVGVCDQAQSGCVTQNMPASSNCEDGLFCTQGDTCDDAGVCQGGSDDPCPDECLTVCDDDADSCTGDPAGTACADDGTFCNGPEECDGSGGCVGIGDPCGSADCSSCDEGAGSCVFAAGNSCDDGVDCTTNDLCDDVGGCAGTQDDSYCDGLNAGDLCMPNCFAAANGCGAPITGMTLVCNSPVSLSSTDASDCTLTLSGSDIASQEQCLSCWAEAGHTIVEQTEFHDGAGACSLNGWALASSAGNNCTNSITACAASGGPRSCCDVLADLCDTGSFSRPVLRGHVDTNCSNDEQWRLSKSIDLSDITDPRVCVEHGEDLASAESGLILFAGTAADPLQDMLVCSSNEYQSSLDGVLYRTCAALPAWAAGNSDVLLTAVAHSENSGDQIFLAGVQVDGWALACAEDRVPALQETFASCDLSAWSVSAGNANCVTGSGCSNETTWRPGVFAETEDMSMQTTVDASDLDGEVSLCFWAGSSSGQPADTLSVWFDSGSGAQTAWASAGNMGINDECAEFCVDLAAIDPAARNNPALVLGFDLAANSPIGVYGVSLSGTRHCAAQAGDLALSQLSAQGAGDYDFTATDLAGQQLTSQIRCSWDPAPNTQTRADLSFTP